MSDIDTRLFRYFVALAEEEHFTRAAERLGITPPTLTHQIKKLEDWLGARLFERKGSRKLVVTETGKRFLGDAREALRHVEQAAVRARQAGRGELGRLELGVVISVFCGDLLPNWTGTFQEANPAIEITMRRLGPMAQINGILRKDLDAGFIRAPQEYPSGIRGFDVYRQRLALALPSKHPLARHKAISPAILAGEAFVNTIPELDVGFFGHTEAVARIGNFIPRVVKRVDDFIIALGYVAVGRGIAVVPELMKAMKFPNVVFRDIAADQVPQISIAFVYGSDPSPSAKLLIRHMRRYALRNRGRHTAPRHNHDRVTIPSAVRAPHHGKEMSQQQEWPA
jgi:DNA-binding transcriptional LysR family regulator